MSIQLIVGLGNPGPNYALTRHNLGASFVEGWLKRNQMTARLEKKFQSSLASIPHLYFCIPTTYMNLSGEAVSAVAKYHQIHPQQILVVHDELDLPVGSIKIKQGGSHAGHNGLRNIILHLNSKDFHRLRIGIGKPTHANKNPEAIANYVLSRPSSEEEQRIQTVVLKAYAAMEDIVAANWGTVMQTLHTPSE